MRPLLSVTVSVASLVVGYEAAARLLLELVGVDTTSEAAAKVGL